MFLFFTLLYIAVGLALTTIAIEIAADYLKKLHYFGRKIENVGNVVIWFGGKRSSFPTQNNKANYGEMFIISSMTMKQLVKNLGDQFNLPVTSVQNLDLDSFVDNAIKASSSSFFVGMLSNYFMCGIFC